jgi:hypothetical protein
MNQIKSIDDNLPDGKIMFEHSTSEPLYILSATKDEEELIFNDDFKLELIYTSIQFKG